jgi:L-iditol 2-dehydrogenase
MNQLNSASSSSGRYNACPDVVFFSTPPYHGLLTRFHAHPACWVHKLPLNVSFEEGALLEPLAVALASVEHAGVKLGDPVLICGAGPIGLVTLLACQAAGACPIAITDISESRLDFAKRTVPSVSTFRVTEGVSEVELGQQIQHLMGEKPQVALECTGRQSSVRTAIFVCFYKPLILLPDTFYRFEETRRKRTKNSKMLELIWFFFVLRALRLVIKFS